MEKTKCGNRKAEALQNLQQEVRGLEHKLDEVANAVRHWMTCERCRKEIDLEILWRRTVQLVRLARGVHLLDSPKLYAVLKKGTWTSDTLRGVAPTLHQALEIPGEILDLETLKLVNRNLVEAMG